MKKPRRCTYTEPEIRLHLGLDGRGAEYTFYCNKHELGFGRPMRAPDGKITFQMLKLLVLSIEKSLKLFNKHGCPNLTKKGGTDE